MKKALIILAVIIVNCTLLIDNCQSQWVQQSVPVTGGYFNDMQFVNANTGFIINWNNPVATFLKTTNAGYNWQILNNWGMAKVAIVDTSCIYASGYNNGKGLLYKSTNLGISWDSIISSNTFYYNNLIFFNRDTGLISSGNSVDNQIWRTTNGGQNLQLITSYSGATSGKFFFLKEKVNGEYYGWMYYPGGSFLKNTTNSGLTWNTLPNISGSFNSIFFVNKDTGWATTTSSRNYVSYTTNGGINWLQQSLSSSVIQYDIYFANPRKGWIAKNLNNYILATSDGGNTWGRQSVPVLGASKLFFLDSINGWIGNGNPIAHTTDGGGPITRIENNTNYIASDYKLYQNCPNPFNPSTLIKYYLKTKSIVELKIFDISGKEVLNVISKEQNAGNYEKLIDFSNKTSGIYFYRLTVKDNRLNTVFSETKRMIYLK